MVRRRNDVRTAFRLARHLARFDEIGDAVAEADLEDLGELLGRRPGAWQAGDAELEAFVRADDGRRDEDLIRLRHQAKDKIRIPIAIQIPNRD